MLAGSLDIDIILGERSAAAPPICHAKKKALPFFYIII